MSKRKTPPNVLQKISKHWFKKGHLNLDQRNFIAKYLIKLKPKYCLEIGFASGRSAATTLLAARPKKLVSVDLSLDYIQGARQHAEFLKKEFKQLRIFEGDSKKVLNQSFFKRHFPQGLDFVFIDGDHTYEGAYADLKAVLPYLNPKGVIFVDDYRSGPPKGVICTGVDQAVEQLVRKNYLSLESWNKKGQRYCHHQKATIYFSALVCSINSYSSLSL